jgi:hypothetical protein
MTSASDFLYPRHRYNGPFTPELLVFDANLQEFAQRIGYIAGLEQSGKLSAQESYEAIESLWQELAASRDNLGIG